MKPSFALLALTALLFGCSENSGSPSKANPTKNSAEQSNVVPKLATALAQAKQEKKFVFLDFTGSDWCAPCQQMERFIFATPRFEEFAQKYLVILKLDFPQKEKLPEAEQQMNDALQEQFHVEAFPTLILLDADGKLVWQADEAPPSLGALLASLEEVVEKK
jgi:thiol:disulfide interchange protein